MAVEVESLLMPGETIVWRGAPNYASAKPVVSGWRRKLGPALWAAGFAVALAGVLWIARLPEMEGLPRTILGVVVAVLIIALLITLITIATTGPSVSFQPNERYFVTDRRLIVINDDRDDRLSFFAGAILRLENHANGVVRNLVVDYGYGEESGRILYALDDAAALEALLIDKFSTRKAAS